MAFSKGYDGWSFRDKNGQFNCPFLHEGKLIGETI